MYSVERWNSGLPTLPHFWNWRLRPNFRGSRLLHERYSYRTLWSYICHHFIIKPLLKRSSDPIVVIVVCWLCVVCPFRADDLSPVKFKYYNRHIYAFQYQTWITDSARISVIAVEYSSSRPMGPSSVGPYSNRTLSNPGILRQNTCPIWLNTVWNKQKLWLCFHQVLQLLQFSIKICYNHFSRTNSFLYLIAINFENKVMEPTGNFFSRRQSTE